MKEDFLKIIQNRRSVRRFSQTPIPENELKEILRTGFSAPSAGNRQPWRVVILKDRTRISRIATAAFGQMFIASASVILVICAVPYESAERYNERGATPYVLQDTAALTQNIIFAAHTLGYATCWIGAFDENEVTEILKIPNGMRPVAIIPIGHAEGEIPKARPRRPFEDVIIEEEF